jgi:general secretion pathway protein I
MRTPAASSQRGFTLLEVMVASLIMAIAVGGLMSGISLSLKNASRVTDYDRATLLAKRKMDALLLDTHLPRMVPIGGDFDSSIGGGGNLKAGWRAMVKPFELPPHPGPNTWFVEQVDLEVWWTTSGDAGRRSITLAGYRHSVLNPADMDAGWVPK